MMRHMTRRLAGFAIGLTAMACLTGGCGKKGGGDSEQTTQLANDLSECRGDLAKGKTALETCKAAADSNQGAVDTSTVTVKVVGDVLTLEARKTGGGGHTTPSNITDAEAQQVYAAAIKVIRINKTAIQACYDRALKQDNSLANQTLSANLEFTILPDGKVRDTGVSPRIGKTFNECVSTSMNNWHFTPLSGKSMKVSAPITLTSSSK